MKNKIITYSNFKNLNNYLNQNIEIVLQKK